MCVVSTSAGGGDGSIACAALGDASQHLANEMCVQVVLADAGRYEACVETSTATLVNGAALVTLEACANGVDGLVALAHRLTHEHAQLGQRWVVAIVKAREEALEFDEASRQLARHLHAQIVVGPSRAACCGGCSTRNAHQRTSTHALEHARHHELVDEAAEALVEFELLVRTAVAQLQLEHALHARPHARASPRQQAVGPEDVVAPLLAYAARCAHGAACGEGALGNEHVRQPGAHLVLSIRWRKIEISRSISICYVTREKHFATSFA